MLNNNSTSFNLTTSTVITAVTVTAVSYLSLIQYLRYRRQQYLESLPDPIDIASAHLIDFELHYMDFPFLTTKALEFGLFKTYAIPSISQLLVATSELVDNCARRYDDTDLIMRTITENPLNSIPSELSIQRLNAIHGKYPQILNEDYIYVLCIFSVEPFHWIEKYGFRSPTKKEKNASYLRWRELGIRMGIVEIPSSWDEMNNYIIQYEKQKMKYTINNEKLANSLLKLFHQNFPSFLHSFINEIIYCFCDEKLRIAMNFPLPNLYLNFFIKQILYMNKLIIKYCFLPRFIPETRTIMFDQSFCPISSSLGISSPCPYGTITTLNGKKEGIINKIDYELKLSEICSMTLIPKYHVYEKIYKNGYRIEKLGPESYLNDHVLLKPLQRPRDNSVKSSSNSQ